MLNSLGLRLLSRREYAVGLAFISALISLAGLPIAWIGSLVIGLVTLSKGAKEGFLVVMWFVLPSIALTIVQAPPLWLLAAVLSKAILLWLLAVLLRRCGSWSLTLQAAAVLGVLSIVALHLIMPNLSVWWVKQLSPIVQVAMQTFDLHYTPAQSSELLGQVAKYATGTVAAVILAGDVFLLMIACVWQSAIFNQAAFLKRELQKIRMTYVASAILLLCAVAAALHIQLALDLLPVMLFPFVFAALSLIHSRLAKKKQLKVPLCAALYVTLVLFLPYMALLLALLGLVDSCYNLRPYAKNGRKWFNCY